MAVIAAGQTRFSRRRTNARPRVTVFGLGLLPGSVLMSMSIASPPTTPLSSVVALAAGHTRYPDLLLWDESASSPGQPPGSEYPYLRVPDVRSDTRPSSIRVQRSISTAKMPLTLPTLISRRPNRFPSRPPTGTRNQQKLYFSPGGHAHDRHTIPPDLLHISLSDPVLIAAEERLARAPNGRSNVSIIKETSTGNVHLGSLDFHLKGGFILQKPGDDDDYLANQPANPFTTSPDHFWKAEFHGAVEYGPNLLDSSDDVCDITEVMTIVSIVDILPGNSVPGNSHHGLDLAPLASEMFKEELYIRGYLKRPASRPANVVPRKPRASFMLMRRKVFPKVLGRRQGRKVAECLKAEQDAIKTPGGPNAHLSEKHPSTIASVTPRAPHTDDLESPGMDTNTSASDSFDLHEFSYITAFTTPPSSPSIILDAETKSGSGLDDRKHAV